MDTKTSAPLLATDSVREECKPFVVSDDQLKKVMKVFLEEIHKGLNKQTKANASVKCFNTYIQDLPTGKETGQFLALDLGGTNFRVLVVTLKENMFDMESKIYVMSQALITSSGPQLFDYVAECLGDFCKEHKLSFAHLPLGFTFSFPVEQKGLNVGILQRWTKGFNCSDSVGKDIAQMLKDAISRKHAADIDVIAILNDTAGTLMSCAWKTNTCKIGLIVGTGSNACYVEKITNVDGFNGDKKKPYVIINTECGAFGDTGELDFVRNEFDREIDSKSMYPGTQLNEKMISGMYMGELVRLVMMKCIQGNHLFSGKSSKKLEVPSSLLTQHVSEIESDAEGAFTNCTKILSALGITNATNQDMINVRYMCECVSRRSAFLVTATMATLVIKMDNKVTTIGVDGTVYKLHPHYNKLMGEKMNQLVPSKMKVNLMLSEDGSGRGAALVAAAASSIDKKQ